MEREREREKKREREDEKKDSSFTKSKKQDCDGQCKYSLEDGESNMENNTSSSAAAAASCEECLGLGVFDFPWLHGEGMVSSSEELNIEDTFSSSLQPNCNNPWYEHEYESSPLGIGEERERERERERKRYYLEEALREGTEDGSESIWSSVLSQPLV